MFNNCSDGKFTEKTFFAVVKKYFNLTCGAKSANLKLFDQNAVVFTKSEV